MHIYKVSKLDNSELEQIVILHNTLLAESFLNKLGHNFIKSFYEACSRDNQNLFYLVKDSGKIVGFLVGTLSNQQFVSRAFFISPLEFIIKIVKFLISSPPKFLILIKSLLRTGFEKPLAELQFIAVDKKYQGQGIGTSLVNKFKLDLKKKKVHVFIVGTQANNQSSNKFYQRLGYKLISQKVIFQEKLNFYQSI